MSITEEEIKKLVIARLGKMPPTMKVSLGSYGVFDKYQLAEEVKKSSEVGEKIIEVHLAYLRSFSRQ